MKTKQEKQKDCLAFGFGLGNSLYVYLGGYIAISELVALLLGPIALLKIYQNSGHTKLKAVCCLGILWLISAVASDLWNVTPPEHMLKGVSKIGIIVLQLAFAYRVLLSDPGRIRLYFIGAAASSILSIYFLKPGAIIGFEAEHNLGMTESFEMQWVQFVANATLAVWFYSERRYPLLSAGIVVIVGAFVIYGGSRNAGATLALAGISVFLIRNSSSNITGTAAQSTLRQSWIFLALLAASASLYVGYKFAAQYTFLGEQAKEKYEEQSSSNIGLLMSGRLDFLAGLLAVQDRPFIGHGSWAQDVVGYRYRAAVIAGMPYYEYEKGSFGRLNGHSNVLEAWTEHGLAALPFWLMMMFIMFQCVNRCFNVHCHFVGPLTFLLFTRLWDFFFSPIVARTTLSFAFALFIIVSLKVQSTKIKAGTSRWRGQRIFRKALS